MSRVFLFVGVVIGLTGCATVRESRYSDYRDKINSDHDAQLRDVKLTPLADRWASQDYRDAYISTACVGLERPACDSKYQQGFFTQLQGRYYAADLVRVTTLCSADPVDCNLQGWEMLAAKSHNEGIQWHREAALQGLEVWFAGGTLTKQDRERIELWTRNPSETDTTSATESDCTTIYHEGFINTRCE